MNRIHVIPGYARKWIRLNWWRPIAVAVFIWLGIYIQVSVSAGRPESWAVGGEFIPSAICWTFALLLAFGERKVRK